MLGFVSDLTNLKNKKNLKQPLFSINYHTNCIFLIDFMQTITIVEFFFFCLFVEGRGLC